MKHDTQLQQEVTGEFGRDVRIDPSHIGVAASRGVVTLMGRVDTDDEKRAAERAAERVKEVKAVVDELEVYPDGGQKPSDEGLATQALRSLAADPAIPDECLTLTIEDGWITVAGEVDWEYQKIAAADDIHRVPGIRGVRNRIVVKAHDVVGG